MSNKVICLLEYPNEGGDQAVVTFIDLTALEVSTDIDASRYAKEIRKAMKSNLKIGSFDDYIGNMPGVEACELTPPCMVTDCVTIYVD